MECYFLPTVLDYTMTGVYLSRCLLLLVQYFGSEVTVSFGVSKPELDPVLAMNDDRVVRRSTHIYILYIEPPDGDTHNSYKEYLHRLIPRAVAGDNR